MANLNELDALYAFLVAAAVAAVLTPLTMRLARSVGAVDEPRERGLSDRQTPLLGGLAIFAGALTPEYESRAQELGERVAAIVERYPLYQELPAGTPV